MTGKPGTQVSGQQTPIEEIKKNGFTQKKYHSSIIGVKQKFPFLISQSWVNEYPEEAMTEFCRRCLQELWRVVGGFENLRLEYPLFNIHNVLDGAIMFSNLNEKKEKWQMEGHGPSQFYGFIDARGKFLAL
ncbi:MAG: hypothetical protein CM15mP106_3900 [Candidatus Neomarinimicrobiota bacterium]|nr:MAG: hypothetical protein CM15mP106_3900 [Candidatus Neomarinimicrobiota bacterium]